MSFDLKITLGVSGLTKADDLINLIPKSINVRPHRIWKVYFAHDAFFAAGSKLLVDGDLTVFCEVCLLFMKFYDQSFSLTLLTKITAGVAEKVSTGQTVASDIKKMFGEELFTDFQLETNDGEVLKAHKVILAARSPVFFSMLSNDLEEARTGSVKILDFNRQIMKEVLRFVYQNEVENVDDIASDLIFAAEKYQLEQLKELCVKSLIATTTATNVLKNFADFIPGSKKLFDRCLLIIIK